MRPVRRRHKSSNIHLTPPGASHNHHRNWFFPSTTSDQQPRRHLVPGPKVKLDAAHADHRPVRDSILFLHLSTVLDAISHDRMPSLTISASYDWIRAL